MLHLSTSAAADQAHGVFAYSADDDEADPEHLVDTLCSDRMQTCVGKLIWCILSSLTLQMLDEAGPEHLADTMGPENTAKLMMEILGTGE